jgi:hypothetical protein
MSTALDLPVRGSRFWGDAVASFAALPAQGAAPGECRTVINTRRIYEWNGSAWQVIGSGSGGDALAADIANMSANWWVYSNGATLYTAYPGPFWIPSTDTGGVRTSGSAAIAFDVSSARFYGNVGFYGNTPTPQFIPEGVTGFVGGSGGYVLSNDTYTGDLGVTAYTWGDIVRCLKLLGILAM